MTHPLCNGPAPLEILSRRQVLARVGMGLGAVALADMLAAAEGAAPPASAKAKAKRVIYLFQSGGPSPLETFDHKPLLTERHGQQLPNSVRQGQRLTGMSAHQASLPLAGSAFPFRRHGKSGAWLSDLLPHTAKVVDDIAIVRSMQTDAIN